MISHQLSYSAKGSTVDPKTTFTPLLMEDITIMLHRLLSTPLCSAFYSNQLLKLAKTMTLGIVFITVGCGWQLRGTTSLPDMFDLVHIKDQQSENLGRLLRQQLSFNGAVITDSLQAANVLIETQDYQLSEKTISLTSNGQIKDVELLARWVVAITPTASGNTRILTSQSRRSVENNDDQLIAAQRDKARVVAEMEIELVNQLLRQLQVLQRQTSSMTSNPTSAPSNVN